MKILSGSLKAGFCSMRIDGKWHRRFTEKEIRYLPQHPFIPGWLRLERALGDFGLQREDLERWFPEFISLRGTRIGELSGGEQRILECFIILRSPARFILLDEPFSQIAPLHVATLQTLIRQEKATKGILLTDHMYRHVTGIADRHCRPAVRNGRRAGLSVRKRRRPGPAGLSEPSLNGHSRR